MAADRRAQPHDAPAILSLLALAWPTIECSESALLMWQTRLEEEDRFAWLTSDGDLDVAVVVAQPLARAKAVGGIQVDAILPYLVTRPDAEGHGHGTRLERLATAHLTRLGLRHAYLEVELSRERSVNFWRNRGWRDGPEERSGGGHVLLMTKSLAAR